MRTTIRMDDDLLELVKAAAAGRGQTLTRFIEDAVRRQLAIQDDVQQSAATLPVYAGDGVREGVDLANNALLREVMDG